jgi:2-haloacid dehalogenase
MRADSVKALFFDVFGTLVDWRSGVAAAAQALLAPKGIVLDWSSFADAWRDQYQPAMQAVRTGKIPYTTLDVLHRQTLQNILPQFSLQHLEDAVLDRLTLAWHELDAWPDVHEGLSRLRRRYLIAPVSNGNTALLCDLARRNDFRWDAILGADYARAYKPMKEVYLAAAGAFNLDPGQCLMCAAHGSDLKAAAANGLQTAYIPRPQERPGLSDNAAAVPADVSAASLLDLATLLNA